MRQEGKIKPDKKTRKWAGHRNSECPACLFLQRTEAHFMCFSRSVIP